MGSRLLLFALALMLAGTATAAPRVLRDSRAASELRYVVTFDTTTTASDLMPVRGLCVATFIRAGSETVTLYQTTASTATGGTAIGTFNATTTSPTSLTIGQPNVYASSDGATTGAQLTIHCSPTQVATSGSQDADGDGYYEVSYLRDFDGDGSTWVTCTGDATPDIGCKATGERVYRDFIDDTNCAVHGCGFGQMEQSGTLLLGEGVFIGWPCWTPTNANTPEAHETNDDQHDVAGGADAAWNDCPVDGDGEPLAVLSLQDWGGTILGSGADTRKLDRGSMSASLRRDIGTYITNDMGPWDVTKNNNVWFSGSDNYRMISTGFHNNVSDSNHATGASATDNASSKGWWKVKLDVNFTTWVTDSQMICLQHSGGTEGTEYKTASTVTNLRAGDVIIIPVKPTSTAGANATTYNTYEAIVRDTPSVVCDTNGRWVNIGGSYIDRTANSTKTFPPHAAYIEADDNVRVLSARTGYDNTRITFANFRIEPQDPWNEFGGRCTNSGTAWRTLVTDTGTAFSTTTDDSNTDMSCDTNPLFGLWGGGQVQFHDIVVSGFHKYAFDAGGTGYADIDGVTFIYGNGQEIADVSNGWHMKNVLVDQSYFTAGILNLFAPAMRIENFTVRNSVFSHVLELNAQSIRSTITGIRNESNGFLTTIKVICGAEHNTVRNVFQTGRGGNAMAGNTPTAVYIDCDDTTRLVQQNVFEDIVVDGMDTSQGGDSAPVITFNVDAASGNSADAQWGAIVGNVFRGTRATGYIGGTGGESSCLYGVTEADADSPADDDGESVIFTKNYFDGGSVESNGRIFCMTNKGSANINHTAIDSTGAATPAWGDPVGCGNMDGGVVYADENCS